MLLKQCRDLRLALDVAEGMCIAPLRLLSALHRPSAPESTTRTSVRMRRMGIEMDEPA